MHLRRVKAIARKEVRHILRDPFTLAMALFAPVFLVIIFGAVIDLDIHDIELAVFDEDSTQASRIARILAASRSGAPAPSSRLIPAAPACTTRSTNAATLSGSSE